MSIPIIASAWNNFHRIPKEDFTSKILHALAMCDLIKDFNKEDKKKLKWLRDNTHINIHRSIYELDRYVDPTKGNFSNNKYTIDGEEFTQDKIQYFLCVAIEKVTQIIYRNFKDFKIEQKLDLDDDSFETNENWD